MLSDRPRCPRGSSDPSAQRHPRRAALPPSDVPPYAGSPVAARAPCQRVSSVGQSTAEVVQFRAAIREIIADKPILVVCTGTVYRGSRFMFNSCLIQKNLN